MKKLLCLLALALPLLSNGLHAELKESYKTPASKYFSMQLRYSPLADKFHWLDQVSGSTLTFFQIPEYRAAWEALYGLSEKDLSYLNRYQTIRKKYQNEAVTKTLNQGLFAPDPGTVLDPMADAFYSNCSLNEALKLLSTKLTPEELRFLEQFFVYFDTRLKEMSGFKDRDLSQTLETLNAHLATPEVHKHLKAMRKFYMARSEPIKSLFLLSGPESYLSGASYGNHLQLRIPSTFLPSSQEHTDLLLTSILVHEATHQISGCAPKKQKELLSQAFLKHSGKVADPIEALEEPLVVASEIYFIKKYHPEIADSASNWFSFTLAEKYLPLLEAYLSADRSIDVEFVENCGKIYQQLNNGGKNAAVGNKKA